MCVRGGKARGLFIVECREGGGEGGVRGFRR